MARIASLAALGRDDLPLAGGKGANLGELTRAGFPVPPGYVVTTQAYDEYVDATGIRPGLLTAQDAAATRALFDAPVPAALAETIADAYRALGEGPVAVRSSATAEDLPDASFAGQQDTYLNIGGEAAVVDAVRRCWASLWTDRAIAYRAQEPGIDQATVALAVVVQETGGRRCRGDPVHGQPAQRRAP